MKPVAPPAAARLIAIIDRFEERAVAVHGDLLLDEFVTGEIARVSREAPVLILDHRESRIVPGGGANTVANLRALGARPLPVGRVGHDEGAERLITLLERAGIDCRGIVRDRSHVTPVKSRILAGSPHTAKQQIVRVDRGGSPAPPSPEIRARITKALARARRQAGGLLIADYGYLSVDPADPALRQWMRGANAAGKRGSTVMVDSRFRLLDFRGMTCATPSIAEVEGALDARIPDDDIPALERAGRRLLSRLGAAALVVTRGSRGMTLFERGVHPRHVPAHGNDEVTDVTGAGDTVSATFTLALLSGASFVEATLLANMAGGIVVTKRGTATVSRQELRRAAGGVA